MFGAIAGALIGGAASLFGASKNSKAIKQASTAEAAANAQNLALQRDIYAQNKAALQPFQASGLAASDNYNALLGLSANPAAANAAYDTFKTASGYQERLKEGYNALNSGYAGAGTLQSGAALKGFARFGQDYAGNHLNQYMAMLNGQQQMGLGAASAQAGVGQTFANNMSNINSDHANAVAQLAAAKANNSNQLLNGLGGLAGTILGRFG